MARSNNNIARLIEIMLNLADIADEKKATPRTSPWEQSG